MSRDFIAMVISRAVHNESFRHLLQTNPEAAADAMEWEYEPEDLRRLKGLQENLVGLDSEEAREFLQGIADEPQKVDAAFLREEE